MASASERIGRSEQGRGPSGPTPPSLDLAALLQSTARGDRVAFRQLYDATSAKLFGIVLRLLRDRQMAEDVMQDVYLKVWESAGRFAPESGQPLPWLIAVARNRAIDVLRRRRELSMPTDQDGIGLDVLLPDPADAEAEFLDADRLAVCLARLDDLHRRCFLDAYLDGYSREELSRRFDRPVNTIKTWLHRGAQTLRTCLSEP